jgi:hypothetical protein
MLHWDEADVVEFFGAEVTFEDAAHSHSVEVSRDGLRLLLTLFTLEGAAYVSLFREGLPEPLITICRELCTHAQVTTDRSFRRCFEAGSTEHPVTNMGIPPILVRGFRVYLDPHFQLELIKPRYDSE